MRTRSLAIAIVLCAATAAHARKWAGAWRAHPRARLLCDGKLAGDGLRVEWKTYAVRAPIARVVAFYQKHAGKGSANERGDLTWSAKPAKQLLVFPAARAAEYLPCAEAPKAGEETLIIVSQVFSEELKL
jgi:hypothetical protein